MQRFNLIKTNVMISYVSYMMSNANIKILPNINVFTFFFYKGPVAIFMWLNLFLGD